MSKQSAVKDIKVMEGPELTRTETATNKSQKIAMSILMRSSVSVCMDVTVRLTKMALTRPISKIVGPRLKTSALRTNEMPRVPRSIALDSAPVWRLRWKPRSRLCK